jgi:pseudaminic acid biosynthesis-associated methylase
MGPSTEQMLVWKGEFGKAYTDRNALSVEEMDTLYEVNYGVTRTELNQRFLGNIEKDARILEIGANIGLQLQGLQKIGLSNLFGLELQAYALQESKRRVRKISMIQGSAFQLPFKDAHFDLVFTSGVLIHIHPSDLGRALQEIQEVPYRGKAHLLWKNDFAKEYLRVCPGLTLMREEHFKYRQNENVDSMFLLSLNHDQK